MPDDDRFSLRLTGAWRKVLRSLEHRDPAERTADAVASALAATMRAVRGVPSLRAIAARMLEDGRVGGEPIRTAPGVGRTHVPTSIAEQAATAMAATMQHELVLVSPADAALMLAKRVLKDLAYHYGLDRMAGLLVRDGAYSVGELRALMDQVMADEQVSKLAKRLLARPSAAGLRAPARRTRRRELRDLLGTDLAEL